MEHNVRGGSTPPSLAEDLPVCPIAIPHASCYHRNDSEAMTCLFARRRQTERNNRTLRIRRLASEIEKKSVSGRFRLQVLLARWRFTLPPTCHDDLNHSRRTTTASHCGDLAIKVRVHAYSKCGYQCTMTRNTNTPSPSTPSRLELSPSGVTGMFIFKT